MRTRTRETELPLAHTQAMMAKGAYLSVLATRAWSASCPQPAAASSASRTTLRQCAAGMLNVSVLISKHRVSATRASPRAIAPAATCGGA